MSTLDNLLDEMFAYGIDWTEYKDKSEHDHEVSTYAGKIKSELKESFKASLIEYINKEIIGEDDEMPTDGSVDWDWEIDRNQLRAEQSNYEH
jgi:hypothetical protein